jgi:hypothetical protein
MVESEFIGFGSPAWAKGAEVCGHCGCIYTVEPTGLCVIRKP